MQKKTTKESPCPLQFAGSESYTLGVELEFQTLDKNSLNLAPLAPVLLQEAPEMLRPKISHEFIRSILEIKTGICHTLKDVENDLLQTCAMAEELALEHDCLLYAASLHPFALSSDQVLTSDVRYERLMNELQIVGRQFISQGVHVHVGMPDGDTAIRVCSAIQPYLPLLLALSGSSPFFQGEDTGLMSYRTKLFEVLPLAGSYENIPDWAEFTAEITMLQDAGVIETIRDLWWDARPHPDFGTLEIRVCDLPVRFNDILGLVALVQAFIKTLAEECDAPAPYNRYILNCNKWQAVRYGLDGIFIDPLNFLAPGKITIRQGVELLRQKIAPATSCFDSSSSVARLDRVLTQGTGADTQRRIYRQHGDFRAVISQLHREFWK